MSICTKDGAWISATTLVRIDCDKCGQGVVTSAHPLNDNQIYDLIREHAKKHNGIDRGY